MIVLLDTSTSLCRLWLINGTDQYAYEWQADRTLAHGLLGYLRDRLAEHSMSLRDITGIGVFRGPGSFTGLRIGITVVNTLADSLDIPAVGATGDDPEWRNMAISRLRKNESDGLVLPEYGRQARITTPRK